MFFGHGDIENNISELKGSLVIPNDAISSYRCIQSEVRCT